MENFSNQFSNRLKFILHGFFFAGAMAIAEPSTILPLIIDYFTDSKLLVGIFSSLTRGGAIIMQMYAAFYAQSYAKVIGKFRIVLIFRFLTWFSIGLSLFLFGESQPDLALLLFGISLFAFSFSAGFGVIYYQELMGKSFTKAYRGKTIAYKQFFSGLSAILSGGVTAWVLNLFEEPLSYAYLFMVSSFFMGIGFLAMALFSEEAKQAVVQRRGSFMQFLVDSTKLLKTYRDLRLQIISRLVAYSFLFAYPFVVLNAKNNFELSGSIIGGFIAFQMAGGMLSNLLWSRLSVKDNKLIILLSFILIISALTLSYWTEPNVYYLLFFLAGAGVDGFRLAYSNLILIIAPTTQRPVFVAVQNNLTSVGLFFPIIGGFLYNYLGFNYLIAFSIGLMFLGFLLSFKLRKQ